MNKINEMSKKENIVVNEERYNKDEPLRPLILLLSIIAAFCLLSILIVFCCIEDWSKRGAFGDAFGGINALFSGMAFGGIIYTILLQRKELRLQRLELSETRKELKRSAEAQEKSELALKKQAESLKISSQLSALNSLITTYTEQEKLYRGIDGGKVIASRTKKEQYTSAIEKILKTIEND